MPDLSPGDFITADDLPAAARGAAEASGLTQTALADALGVTAPSVSQALTGRPGLDVLRLRILAHCAGVEAEGPGYRVASVARPTDG